MMKKRYLFSLMSMCLGAVAAAAQPADHLFFKGDANKAGQNKHVVLIAGDEEYRSEEAMPMLAQILTKQGFQCTVLFSMDAENKYVDPNNQKSLSHPEALDSADAIVMSLRFRDWPDASFEKFNAAFQRGVPLVALRTSTHAFRVRKNSAFYQWSVDYKEKDFHRGFGRQILGESWAGHWGKHAVQGTRTKVEQKNQNHPVLNGVGTIFAESDVYGANPLRPATILLRGMLTETLESDSAVVTEGRGEKHMPVVWLREHQHSNGNASKIFTTTMGAAVDLTDENLRRLVINGVYWGLGIEVPEKADAALQSTFHPTMYGFKDEADGLRKGFQKMQTPSDLMNVGASK